MDFSSWLAQWLKRHPMKDVGDDPQRFTQNVMARVREEKTSSQSLWGLLGDWGWPRLALACGGVAATVVLAVMLIAGPMQKTQLAGRAASVDEISKSIALLAAIDELSAGEPIYAEDMEDTAESLDRVELLMFAEEKVAQTEDQWLEQTLLLLNQFDEDVPQDSLGEDNENEEDWLREFKMLDEADLTAKL